MSVRGRSLPEDSWALVPSLAQEVDPRFDLRSGRFHSIQRANIFPFGSSAVQDVDDAFGPHCGYGIPRLADQRHGRRFAGQVCAARLKKMHRFG